MITKPVTFEIIIGAIGAIVVMIGIGLGLVEYYKRKREPK